MQYRTIRAATRLGALLLAGAWITPGTPAEAQVRPYQGDIVIRAELDTPAEVERMLEISPDPWSHRVGVGFAEFRVPGAMRAELDASGIDYEILIGDLQAVVDAERDQIALRVGAFYDNYRDLVEIENYVDSLIALHPTLASSFVVGQSIEGRTIRGVKVGAAGVDKPGLLIFATQHAREWIAPMAATYLADRLLTDYATDTEVQRILDSVDIYIIPVANPDGYVYSWTVERFWRKNRRNNPGSFEGVDLNRNWGAGWGGSGSSSSTSSEVYRGTAPFSEPETAAIRDFFLARPEIRAMIDVHTYGQYILSPPGYSTSVAPQPDDKTFNNLSKDLYDAVFSVHQEQYVYGPAGAVLYIAAGDAPDWFYGRPSDRDGDGDVDTADLDFRAPDAIPSWTFELRPASSFEGGFAPSASLIRPTAEEFFAAGLLAADLALRSADIRIQPGLPSEAEPDTPTPLTSRIYPLPGWPGVDTASVTLHARTGPGDPWQSTAMTPLPGDQYAADLPAAPAGAVIEYYLEAAATEGPATTLPSTGADDPLTLRVNAPADLNDDGVVDGADLGILLGAWGGDYPPADLNADGVIDGADLGILLGAWTS